MQPVPSSTAEDRIARLEAALASERAALAAERTALTAAQALVSKLTVERDQLRAAHERLRLELELLRRRIFVAKAERVDTAQLELEFAHKLAELDRLGGMPRGNEDDASKLKDGKRKPTGRRNLRHAAMEEERIEITDPLFEELVAKGQAERMGHEESCKLAYKRGGQRRLVIARVKYRAIGANGEAQIETAPMPPECFPRSLAAPSMLSKVINEKFCDGMPFNRVEDRTGRDGFPIDRGTLCRWAEDAGATAGATVVAAMRKHATATAFCMATDATGVAVQPLRSHEKKRQACRRGHYFVIVADRDHVFFEYTPKETSRVVSDMFRGFSGYIQADAKSVYDVLFREPDPPDDGAVRHEVGCWSHARRKFWEAAAAKNAVAREALARIGRFFDLEETWRGKPPSEILRLRQAHLRPHLEAFFAWAQEQYALVEHQRGSLRSAFGYALRQKDALTRVLDDGRLVLENNRSELELRRIANGRKVWLFVGSDDHAESAGHLFTLIASARLHQLDPETYLRDLFRVLAHWPSDRYLELAPKFWAATRARLDPAELAMEIGPLAIPQPLATEEQPASR
jgi:transposase